MHDYTQPPQLVKMKKKVIQTFEMLVLLQPTLLPPLSPKRLKSFEKIHANPQSIRRVKYQQKGVPPLCKLQE